MAAPHFGPGYFAFFRDLAENNTREWFAEHKPRYEAEVKAPLLDFIRAFAPRLEKISPHLVADDRGNGGSMFRIHRDTRFSKDKTPYKTHGAIQFRHEAGKDAHAPGFYLHLGPDEVFVGAGIWRPERSVAEAIRSQILARPEAWTQASTAKSFARHFELRGEGYKRPPAGVPADHPLLEDLKRKDFIAVAEMDEAAAGSPGFMNEVAARYRAASDFTRFLTEAVGQPY